MQFLNIAFLVTLLGIFSSPLIAQEGAPTKKTDNPTQVKPKKDKAPFMKELTPEQREEMAKSHEAMAKCLRTTKPVMECHEEMHKACMEFQGGCPMMMGGRGPRGMHRGMRDGQAAPRAKPVPKN